MWEGMDARTTVGSVQQRGGQAGRVSGALSTQSPVLEARIGPNMAGTDGPGASFLENLALLPRQTRC